MAVMHSRTLLIPAKADLERDPVAATWETMMGPVMRLDRFWDPPDMDNSAARLYGNDTFCLVLAEVLGLELVSPPDDLLIGLDRGWLGRDVAVAKLSEVGSIEFPKFIKPLVPKQFRAGVYGASGALLREANGLDGSTLLQIADVVAIEAEARCFVLNQRVVTAAFYEGAGDPEAICRFVDDLAQEVVLPTTVVIDVGVIEGDLAVIEANATWGAGLNGCDPVAVVRCLDAAVRASGGC